MGSALLGQHRDFEDGTQATYDPAQNITLLQSGDRFTAIATAHPPVQVTGHESLDALCQDYEENGYFTRDSRAATAPVLALRFNLEMMRAGTYAAAVADSAPLAIAAAKAALVAQQPASDATTPHAESLAAIRDIVGWNTIWDATNNRPYTAVTRIWNLGTFAVWHNDQTYAALLAGIFDTDLARENLATALSAATPQGNFACISTSRDTWVDRSQPPLGSLIAWQLYQRSGERSILEQCYPAMARNQRWWRAMRDPDGTGLISCGTSDVGEALYKGTAFGARNETGMDNSATHDEAMYDPETRSLSTWDLGLNCVVALDAEMLALIATTLGHPDEAAEFDALATNHRALIQTHLWDETRQIFANRQRHGAFVRSLSPTSFYRLLCNAASPEQTAHLLRHLSNPETFAGQYPLPNATRNDPAFADNVYWRGRIWPNVNYLVWRALRRTGHDAQATLMAKQSLKLFLQNWRTNRIAAENYNATTGEAMDQGDTDPFYIWAGLLPLMAVSELIDIDPWHGLTLTNNAEPTHCGPMVSPYGPLPFHPRARLMLSPLSPHTKHVVIDLQRLFAEPHGWHVPSIAQILPNVLALCQTTADKTLYSRFITPPHPKASTGRWQNLYQAYPNVTGLAPAILALIEPLAKIAQPSQIFDKTTYSIFPAVHLHLTQTDTLILSGAETDACVYASLLSAVDLGLRVIIATNAVTSSDQAAHDATLNIIARRLPAQIELATTAEIIAAWPR